MQRSYMAKELSDLKKGYEGILVRNLSTIDEILDCKISKTNDIVIPSFLFENILELGEEINNLEDQSTDNNEQINELLKEWIETNHYPYPIDDKPYYEEKITYIKFREDIETIYLVYSFMELLNNMKKKNENHNLKMIKYYLNKLNIKKIVLMDFDYVRFTNYYDIDIDTFLSCLEDGNEKNIYTNERIIIIIKNILITLITKRISNDNYWMIDNYPIFIYKKKASKYQLYKEANCLMGIIYNHLIKYLITSQDKVNLVPCNHCNTLYVKHGNQKYCEDCIKLGIPKKLRDAKFNNSQKGKKYHTDYYKKR